MGTPLRILDDGAWLSVDDTRRVSVSELWRLDSPGFCGCDLVSFLTRGFTAAAADGSVITLTAVGTCIACGATGTIAHIPVGRLVDGRFAPLDRQGGPLTPHDTAPGNTGRCR